MELIAFRPLVSLESYFPPSAIRDVPCGQEDSVHPGMVCLKHNPAYANQTCESVGGVSVGHGNLFETHRPVPAYAPRPFGPDSTAPTAYQ
mgnify:CR=1 FL=1|jgi:hypothetical protein